MQIARWLRDRFRGDDADAAQSRPPRITVRATHILSPGSMLLGRTDCIRSPLGY